MTLPAHILDLIHEVADAIVNRDGYADDPAEADRRADRRDRLEADLRTVVEAAQR